MSDLDGVTLPDNLHWPDEFTWSPVGQTTERTLSGAMVVEEAARQGGRPITLRGAWIDRTTVDALRSLEQQVGTNMTLTLPDGRTFTVLFRRDSSAGVEAEPLFPRAAPDTETLYALTLRLMEANP